MPSRPALVSWRACFEIVAVSEIHSVGGLNVNNFLSLIVRGSLIDTERGEGDDAIESPKACRWCRDQGHRHHCYGFDCSWDVGSCCVCGDDDEDEGFWEPACGHYFRLPACGAMREKVVAPDRISSSLSIYVARESTRRQEIGCEKAGEKRIWGRR